jgi:hypothetical protein
VVQLGRHVLKLLRMPSESVIFVQFPAYGAASKFLLPIILRRFRSIVLIHDLERLRGRSGGSTEAVLKQASFIIYTGRLWTQLENVAHIPGATLEAWDYRLESGHQSPAWDPAGPVLFAGNLAKSKNDWLYRDCRGRPKLLLYGNHYREDLNPNIGDEYRGEFSPDEPSFKGPISWGLVWEGRSTSKCSPGVEHEYYERFNQPHKLSLYLACRLPVIVWRKSAIADFVERHRCGILVDDLEEIDAELKKCSKADLLAFRDNADRLSSKIRSGYFIRQAVSQFVDES